MKKSLQILACLTAVFGGISHAVAGTTNIYVEGCGTANPGVILNTDGALGSSVGWSVVAVTQTAGPYVGIYAATGAADPATGESLPANTAYFSVLLPNQTTPGMMYVTNGSPSGSGGNS